MIGSVAVIGGGIAGIYASLELAESGFKVYLIEEKPTIGGKMLQLDKTFPTNDCAICILSPKMVEVSRHPNIELLTYCDVKSISGEAGNFSLTINKKARFVDIKKCTGCGTCSHNCPVKIPDPFNENINTTKCIRIPFPQAVPLAALIDKEHCKFLTEKKCGNCLEVCKAGAINYEEKDEEIILNTGSIIIATGAGLFNPATRPSYNYRNKDVITAMEFERYLSASGPTGGKLLRPSDNQKIKKLGFIQCVGARDIKHNEEICSAVCCTYATKEALVAKEHNPGLDVYIFYIDLRAYGKGCEEFYRRAREEYGVKYIRSKDVEIKENNKDKLLTVGYEDPADNKYKKMELDMIVLSVAFKPEENGKKLSNLSGIELDKFGYVKTALDKPVTTSIKGIFTCGTVQGPKDIPDSVAQGMAAASEAKTLLSSARGQLAVKKEYPPEMEIAGEPRIGVFICHCGINIGGTVDVEKVAGEIKNIPGVVYSEHNSYTCSQDTQENIKKAILSQKLNRVIVASCTPRTHEELFRNTCREAGLNPYLFEFCNIREQCAWVHSEEKEKATEKAVSLIKMSIARAKLLKPLYEKSLQVTKKALVIGGGISGITATLQIANQGYPVVLLEKEKEPGGFIKNIRKIQDGRSASEILKGLINSLKNNSLIECVNEAEIEDVTGYKGNFKAKIKTPAGEREVDFGAAIIATGASLLSPKGNYHYGENDKIVTQRDLEQIIENGFAAGTVVMIQCVGSREKGGRTYCSRVCCSEAIKNAINIKTKNTGTDVYILYRDIRAYGVWESMYNTAREMGVIFIPFDEEIKPEVNPENLTVTVYEKLLSKKLILHPDYIVLSSSIISNKDNIKISRIFKIPLDENGFFMEAHVKLRPVDFANDGIFVCGTAHYPKMIYESIAQASAAASRVTTIFSQDSIKSDALISFVNTEKCIGCGLCASLCPFQAIRVNTVDGKAEVIAASCKGCGVCGASCPNKAITMEHFTDEQIMAEVDALKAE